MVIVCAAFMFYRVVKIYTLFYMPPFKNIWEESIPWSRNYVTQWPSPFPQLTQSGLVTPYDIRRHKIWSKSFQVMACCPTALSHLLNQCRLINSTVVCHSPEGNFTGNTHDILIWVWKLLFKTTIVSLSINELIQTFISTMIWVYTNTSFHHAVD